MPTLEVTDGKIFVSDPCYDFDPEDVLFQCLLTGAKNGLWVGYCDEDNEYIVIHHVNHYIDPDKINIPAGKIGVDSGMAGFFVPEMFKRDDLITWEPKFEACGDPDTEPGLKWYNAIAEHTLHGKSPEVKGAIVSGTYNGDGLFPLSVAKNKDGEIVAAKISFVEDDKCEECGEPVDCAGNSYCSDCESLLREEWDDID